MKYVNAFGGALIILFILGLFVRYSKNTDLNDTTPAICSDVASVKRQAQTIRYKELEKDPNRFSGKVVKFTGNIQQIQESNNQGYLRLAVTSGLIWRDEVYVEYQNHTDAVDGDIVTVYGPLTGSETYTSTTNFEITLPRMTACAIVSGRGAAPATAAPGSENMAVSAETAPQDNAPPEPSSGNALSGNQQTSSENVGAAEQTTAGTGSTPAEQTTSSPTQVSAFNSLMLSLMPESGQKVFLWSQLKKAPIEWKLLGCKKESGCSMSGEVRIKEVEYRNPIRSSVNAHSQSMSDLGARAISIDDEECIDCSYSFHETIPIGAVTPTKLCETDRSAPDYENHRASAYEVTVPGKENVILLYKFIMGGDGHTGNSIELRLLSDQVATCAAVTNGTYDYLTFEDHE